MQAILLAGGFGTRLHPLTLTTPKQLLTVAGRPMIEHVVAGLVRHGVDRVVLSLGYREEAFRTAYPDGRCAGVEFVCAVEPEPLGTASAIRFAWTESGARDEAFLAVNADVITDLDAGLLARRHKAAGAEATIHLTGVDDPSRYGVVVTDDDGRVTDFVEKPAAGKAPSRWVNAGTYVMETSVIDRIPARGPSSVERDTFPALAEAGTLWAMSDDAYWLDAGTPESYLRAQLDLLEGRRAMPAPGRVPFLAGDVTVAAGARVHSSVVKTGAAIGMGARVEHSVVLDGASVGTGARVVRSVVMEGAVIGAYAVVSGSVVGPSASAGPGSVLTDGTLIGAGASVNGGETLAAVRHPDLR